MKFRELFGKQKHKTQPTVKPEVNLDAFHEFYATNELKPIPERRKMVPKPITERDLWLRKRNYRSNIHKLRIASPICNNCGNVSREKTPSGVVTLRCAGFWVGRRGMCNHFTDGSVEPREVRESYLKNLAAQMAEAEQLRT